MSLESATNIADLVTTNPTGADGKAQGDNHIRLVKSVLKTTFPNADRPQYLWAGVVDVASAATALVYSANSYKVRITGTTQIDAFETAPAGVIVEGYFAAAVLLNHNATSFILNNNAEDITTEAGDSFWAISLGSGNWKVNVTRVNGKPLVRPASELLTSGTWSAVATGDINLASFASLSYSAYQVLVTRWVPATDNVAAWLRLSADGTTFDSGATDYLYSSSVFSFAAFTDPTASNDGSQSELVLATTIGNTGAEFVATSVWLPNPETATHYPMLTWEIVGLNTSTAPLARKGWGARAAAQRTRGFRFMFSSGDIASAAYSVIGHR